MKEELLGSSWFEMTPEQLDKLHAMVTPQNEEALKMTEERLEEPKKTKSNE